MHYCRVFSSLAVLLLLLVLATAVGPSVSLYLRLAASSSNYYPSFESLSNPICRLLTTTNVFFIPTALRPYYHARVHDLCSSKPPLPTPSSLLDPDCIPCSSSARFSLLSDNKMSAHARKVEIVGTASISTDEEWDAQIAKPCLTVVDVYAKFAGPCEPMQNIFKRLKLDYGEAVNFVAAASDNIEALASLRNKSCPTFLFFFNGALVKIIKGANAPGIEATIKEQLDLEKKGLPHVALRLDNLSIAIASSSSSAAAAASISADPSGGAATAANTASALSPLSPMTPMSATAERTLAIIKPDAMAPAVVAQILDVLRRQRFEIVGRRKVWLTPAQVEELYKEHEKENYFQGVLTHMSTAPVLALILEKDAAVAEWRKLMGPANSGVARSSAPSSLRALFGTDNRLNAVYGSETLAAAGHEIEFVFGPDVLELPLPEYPDVVASNIVQPSEKTLALIKPDIVEADAIERIVERIVCRGYQVLKRETVQLSVEEAESLYEHLKNEPHYKEAAAFMASGPVVAMALKGADVVAGWREMVGPADSDAAKAQLPMSIRAVFGSDTIRNAVHGSASPDDAQRELRQLFPALLTRAESAGNGLGSTRPSMVNAHVPDPNAGSGGHDNNLTERTLALIKPDAFAAGHRDAILERIRAKGFKIVAEKEVELTRDQAREFYKEHDGQAFYEELVTWMSTPDLPIYAMVLERDTAITAWRELAGPTNSIKAREIAPESIRALYGKDGSKNAVHGSDSPQSAEREIRIVFGDSVSPFPAGAPAPAPAATAPHTIQHMAVEPPTPTQTLALIKPDAYGAGKKDEIIAKIKADGFKIVKEQEQKWTPEKAAEFYKEHVGKPFYETLISWMSSAPIYAMVLEKHDGVRSWRDLAGPTNSNTARETSSNSIRALYGTDGSQNAVHGSDSPQSAAREIGIVFGGGEVQQTLALIKPDAYGAGKKDEILARIRADGFKIVQEGEQKWSAEKAGEFYKEHVGKPFYDTLTGWMSSAPIYALVLEKKDGIKAWRDLAGPTNSNTARETSPKSIRALFGTDGSQNAVHGSDSPASAAREIGIVFGAGAAGGGAVQQTLALIKPDAYGAGKKDDIIARIKADGFQIVQEQEQQWTAEKAGEFYKEHVGKPFYETLTGWMSRYEVDFLRFFGLSLRCTCQSMLQSLVRRSTPLFFRKPTGSKPGATWPAPQTPILHAKQAQTVSAHSLAPMARKTPFTDPTRLHLQRGKSALYSPTQQPQSQHRRNRHKREHPPLALSRARRPPHAPPPRALAQRQRQT
ncbi:nucleoside diphosphate kinase [Geranomyces variabilis]|nr:nucleoside diphosphate kinase [Geranomyces variabilis]